MTTTATTTTATSNDLYSAWEDLLAAESAKTHSAADAAAKAAGRQYADAKAKALAALAAAQKALQAAEAAALAYVEADKDAEVMSWSDARHVAAFANNADDAIDAIQHQLDNYLS